jgi:hypothetical protein
MMLDIWVGRVGMRMRRLAVLQLLERGEEAFHVEGKI